MANQVKSRLSGDDYQHLFSWQAALELLMPRRHVFRVTIEDESAGSVDDVTIEYELDASKADEFYQYKYHVDYRSEYSSESVISNKPGEASLLEKFWRTWQILKTRDSDREVRLHLVSNWTWDAKDKFKSCIDGRDNRIKEAFITAGIRSDIGKIRKKWQKALRADDASFREFIGCLRLRLGFDCSDELETRIAERMDFLRLKSDSTALLVAAGIVREWIKKGKQQLSKADMDRVLHEHDLILPSETEPGTTVYLTTIKSQTFDIDPDHIIDWRSYFAGAEHAKGRTPVNPNNWNTMMLPELHQLESQLNSYKCRLIRARGLSRLSAWLAFGFTFSSVDRYIIEVDQNGRLWRTDEKANADFTVVVSQGRAVEGELLNGDGETVAGGISVTGSLDNDVRKYLASRTDKIAAMLLLRPERELGPECLRDAGDAVALADSVKKYLRDFVKHWNARRLLLFYFGPLSGACFIGHRLNAVCREIQVMEDQQPGYSPSFLLS